MSCGLTIIGENLDVDALVNKINIIGFEKFYKGDPINKVNNRKRKFSYASIITSGAAFDDIPSQISDTIKFLHKHKKNLSVISGTTEIQFATINFGVTSSIDKDHLTENFYFPTELVKVCGELELGIELSIYKEDLELILDKRTSTK